MKLSQYNPKLDSKHMEAMLFEHDLPKSAIEELPKYGLIFFVENRPIAIGFLRHCEGTLAMLDNYISSKNEPPELRDKAFDIITKSLIRAAKKQGITTILAYSVEQNIISRAIKHGFVATPHVMTMKRLG